MPNNFACNCCEPPPATRIALQFASFDRACSNTCILKYGDSDPWDWLAGPFLTAQSASASDSLSFSNESGYRSNWSRTTSASLEITDFLLGNNGPYDCPCANEYTESQSSYRMQRTDFEIDGQQYYSEEEMSCNGSGGCPLECPPYLNPPLTAGFGAGGAYTINFSLVNTYPPYSNLEYEDTTNCTCEEPCQCPVPFPWNNAFPDGAFKYIEPTITYYGESAMCGFAIEDEGITFPAFPSVIKLIPTSEVNSGFVTQDNPNLPDNQGYASSTFRYARGPSERPMQQSEQYVKWRVIHNPTATCYLKIWFVKKKTVTKKDFPNVYVPPIVTWEDAGTYEWNGTQNPCVDQGSIYDVNNIVYGEEEIMTLPQPSVGNREYGIEEEIFIKKVSVIKDYEPPDPPADSAPPEKIQYGWASQDLSINPNDWRLPQY